MKPIVRNALLAAVIAGLAALLLALTQPELRWRLAVVQQKLTGQLPDVGFAWLIRHIRPGSPIYLEQLASTPNPYAVIRNPRRSADDILAGEDLYVANCASCHAEGAHGSVVSLFDDENRHGDSDWALYSSITRGIAGTGMLAQDLTEDEAWQVVAYIRSETARATATSGAEGNALAAIAAVDFDRIVDAHSEPHNWLTFSGSVDGQRFSRLDRIDRDNVGDLRLAWVYHGSAHDDEVEATPLVVDGVLVTTEPPGTVLALDAATGETLWRYRRRLPGDLRICCGPVNRGAAIADGKVFVGTLDAHLVALDFETGQVVWDVETAEHSAGYSNTAAPLVVGDTVVVGVAGGEYGIRGFIDAYDIESGERRWRFETIPAPGAEGAETWPGDSWRNGGGPTWMTGSYDPASHLLYWATGNPGPDFNSFDRQGDNLFTNSIVALDPASGKRAWHFQFTPEDVHDYDANHLPVIANLTIDDRPRRVVMSATKNGFFYVLDAQTGEFISALPITRQTWALSIDGSGRPIRNPDATPKKTGTLVYPGAGGGANWWPTSFNPELGLAYVSVKEGPAIFFSADEPAEPGELYLGGTSNPAPNEPRYNALLAIDPVRREIVWRHSVGANTGGSLATAGNLVFWGNAGVFQALDAASGEVLWEARVGGKIVAPPMSYAIDGRQYVAVSAGRGLFVFAL